jgi:L-2-hydroxyglutarate oxidase LhgO
MSFSSVPPGAATARQLQEHDPEKCVAVFQKDHAQTMS